MTPESCGEAFEICRFRSGNLHSPALLTISTLCFKSLTKVRLEGKHVLSLYSILTVAPEALANAVLILGLDDDVASLELHDTLLILVGWHLTRRWKCWEHVRGIAVEK